ncbi:ABC transporter permease [Nonomuraea basaltis]|uniref:ABC transporter permease n=1 Tax=Nonomuraea basaltis TaxID=2495887 RepID=UPI0014875EEC|nr:ABC transporter permease [Nonomuraea basaltis]
MAVTTHRIRPKVPRLDRRYSAEYGVALLLIGLAATGSASSATFRGVTNLLLIVEQSATLLIVALPFGLLLMCRYIDLSVGSLLAVLGVVTAELMATSSGLGWNPWLVGALVLAIAAAYGMAQGWAVTRFTLNPFVLSLGLLAALRGLAFMIQGSEYAEGMPRIFQFLGQGRVRGIDLPLSVVIAAVLAVAFFLYAHNSRHGRHTQALAGNAKAAFLAGIPVRAHVITLYLILGLSVGIAALIQTSKLDSGPATVGNGFELAVLTAVLLGGVAFDGGRGSVPGIVLGCVFITTFTNALRQWGVGANESYLANGVVLALAAGLPALAAGLPALAAQIVRRRQEAAAREAGERA